MCHQSGGRSFGSLWHKRGFVGNTGRDLGKFSGDSVSFMPNSMLTEVKVLSSVLMLVSLWCGLVVQRSKKAVHSGVMSGDAEVKMVMETQVRRGGSDRGVWGGYEVWTKQSDGRVDRERKRRVIFPSQKLNISKPEVVPIFLNTQAPPGFYLVVR